MIREFNQIPTLLDNSNRQAASVSACDVICCVIIELWCRKMNPYSIRQFFFVVVVFVPLIVLVSSILIIARSQTTENTHA